MDTFTQIALGASVGHAAAGRQVGRRAIFWGGLLAALPDLDVLIPYGDMVSDFTYHRSWSHSLPVMTAVTPLLAWLILKIHPPTRPHRGRWYLLVFLALATHTLLDCFTVYGTQILWPIPMEPVGWSTVFIIDPAYTVPLLFGILAAVLWHNPRPRRGSRLNALGITLSCIYLAWTVAAKLTVERAARERLAKAGVEYQRLLTTPAPFNSLLWRIVVMVPDGYLEGYYSLVSGGPQPRFTHHLSDTEALAAIANDWPVNRLRWFTRGFYSVSAAGSDVIMTDLRMGSEPYYAYRFIVAQTGPHGTSTVEPRQLDWPAFRPAQLAWVWHRIWSVPGGGADGFSPAIPGSPP